MKKSTKSSSRGSRKSTPKVRHSKSKQKPVTIDLTAEKIEKPLKSETKPTGSSESVPKFMTEKTAAKNDDKKSDFGRKTAPTAAKIKTDAKTQTEKPSNSTQPPKKPAPKAANNNSVLSKLGPAVIGGVVALSGAGLLQYMGVLSTPGSNSTGLEISTKYVSEEALTKTNETLMARISGLEENLKNASTKTTPAPTIDMKAINTAIDTRIKEQISALPKPTALKPEVGKAELKNLTDQILGTDNKIETLQSQLLVTDKTVDALKNAISTGAAGENAGLASINKTVTALESKIDDLSATTQTLAMSSNERGAALADLQKTSVSEGAGKETSVEIPQDLTKSIEALQTKIESLTATTQTLAMNSNERGAAITELQKLTNNPTDTEVQASLEKTVAALQTKIEALKNTAQSLSTGANEQRAALAELTTNVENTAKSGQQAAIAISAAALKNDIDQGLPFAASLKTLQATTGESKSLTALSAFAETGVPTTVQLVDQFKSVGPEILVALAPEPKDDIVSRLLLSAKSLVKTKSIRAKEGSDPAALVSQITANLANGDLDKASTRWAT